MAAEKWEKAKEIFTAALECDERSQRAYVAAACGEDEELRHEVSSLLAAFAKANDFIENPAVSDALKVVDEQKHRAIAGRRIGQYTLVKEVGQGGMGVVYLATRADEEFDKQVVIKLIKRGMDSDDILRRFKNERQILASLDHPNIAKLLDGGTTEEGLPFFVMDYIEGQPLTDYCDNHQLSTRERLKLFRQICSAVQRAHQNLIVHRDLKPSNILITADGVPKLLDFGIAKILKSDVGEQTQTATVARMMTKEYASPEQIRGEPVTTASDLYSLGVLLYKLLTGHHPYQIKTPLAQEVERVICESIPERPSTVISRTEIIPTADGDTLMITPESVSRTREGQPDKLKRALSGDLDNIVLMALRKEPERRYSSVAEFSEDIRRHLEGLPVIATKDTFSYRASKFIKRHKVGVAATVFVFLAILAGLTVSIWQARVAQRERAKAEAINNFLQTMLGAASPESVLRQHNSDVTVKDVLDEASKRLASEDLASQPEVKAELQRIIGATYLTLGQYDVAEQNLNAALQTQNAIYGENSLETLKTLVVLGQLWLSKGDNARADTFYRQRLAILRREQKKGNIHPDYLITALSDFGLLRRAQGDSKEAEALYREALALRPQASEDAKANLGIHEGILALTLADQGKFDEAIKFVRAKVAAIRQQTTDGTPELCANLTGLGSFLLEEAEVHEAAEDLREAEAIYRKLFSSAYLPLGDNLRLQAQAFYLEHNYVEAEVKISEALNIYRAMTSPQYINYATALLIQGMIFSQTNRVVEAEKLLREAVQIRSAYMPEAHFLRAVANGFMGEFLITQKRYSEAEPILLNSYESLKSSQAAHSPRIKMALQRLITLYDSWGKSDMAAQYRNIF